MEKICTKCKVLKPLEDFNKKKASKDGVQSHCRLCEKENHKKHYALSRDAYKARARINTKRYVAEYREWKKTLSCQCCGESEDVCIDLHHLDPVKKDFNIGDVGQRSGLRSVLKEIDKCAVVCSNCHRKIHKYGNEWYYKHSKNAQVAERPNALACKAKTS